MFFLGKVGGGGLTAAVAMAVASVGGADVFVFRGGEFVGLFHGALRIARPAEGDPSFVLTRRDASAVVLGFAKASGVTVVAAFALGVRFRVGVAAAAAVRSVLDVIPVVILASETKTVSVILEFPQEEGTLSFGRGSSRRRSGQFSNGIVSFFGGEGGSGRFLLPADESTDSSSVNFRHEDVDEGSVGDDEVLTRDIVVVVVIAAIGRIVVVGMVAVVTAGVPPVFADIGTATAVIRRRNGTSR